MMPKGFGVRTQFAVADPPPGQAMMASGDVEPPPGAAKAGGPVVGTEEQVTDEVSRREVVVISPVHPVSSSGDELQVAGAAWAGREARGIEAEEGDGVG